MDVLMNGLLLAASLFAGSYCWVLARRVRELKSLDRGLGGAIVTLTRQIELARGTLDEARAATRENRQDLTQLVARADAAAAQLKLAVATAEETRGRMPEPRVMIVPGETPVPASVAPRPEARPEFRPEPRPEPRLESVGRVDVADLVPKPRILPPVESPLRPRPGREIPGSEEDLMLALSALAAGRS